MSVYIFDSSIKTIYNTLDINNQIVCIFMIICHAIYRDIYVRSSEVRVILSYLVDLSDERLKKIVGAIFSDTYLALDRKKNMVFPIAQTPQEFVWENENSCFDWYFSLDQWPGYTKSQQKKYMYGILTHICDMQNFDKEDKKNVPLRRERMGEDECACFVKKIRQFYDLLVDTQPVSISQILL